MLNVCKAWLFPLTSGTSLKETQLNSDKLDIFCIIDADDTDFENFRMGMWTQPKADAFDWQFKTGFTQTMNTGPMKDHTTGSGNNLLSNYHNPSNKSCLENSKNSN